MPFVRSPLAFPPDVEAEEVEPVAHVHHLSFGLGESKSQGFERVGDVFSQGFDVCLVTVHEYDEIVCLCRLADYADRGVMVLVDGGDRGRVVGIIPAL